MTEKPTYQELVEQVAELEKESAQKDEVIEGLTNQNRKFMEELALLKGEEIPISIDDVIDKEKDPEAYELASGLMAMDEEERKQELEKIFTQIPEWKGVFNTFPGKRISALEFLEKYWRLWINLKLALRLTVQKYSGTNFIFQVDREIRRDSLNRNNILPSQRTQSQVLQSLITPSLKRGAQAVIKTEYRKRNN